MEKIGMSCRPLTSKTIVLSLSALLISLVAASMALAKGPVDKITITGLDDPIEITDEASLAPFDPWSRGFIAWDRGLVEEPPSVIEETYTVSFHIERGDGEFSLIYVLHYAPARAGGPGYIYIPGPGDPYYQLNIGTIITGSSDQWDPNDKWQYATAEWDALMLHALGEHSALGSADGASEASSGLPTAKSTSALVVTREMVRQKGWFVALVLGTSVIGGIVFSLWRLRRFFRR